MSSMSSLSSSSKKRKREWIKEVVGEQIVSAAAVGIAGCTISTVLGGYGELNSVDEQLEHVEWMVTEIGSAVADAALVSIRSSSLRRWLGNLQEAACEGKAVARSLRQRRAEEAITKSGNVLWEGAKLVFRSAKRALMGDEDMERLSRTLRKLERASAGTGRFLKLLEMEISGKGKDPAPRPAPSRESRFRTAGTRCESDLADGGESKVSTWSEQGVLSAV